MLIIVTLVNILLRCQKIEKNAFKYVQSDVIKLLLFSSATVQILKALENQQMLDIFA